MPWLFLALSLVGAMFTLNAYRPARGPYLLGFSFFAAWLTGEAPLHHLAWQAAATAVFIALGALHSWPGDVGLVVTILSWAGLVGLLVRARRARAVAELALADGLGASYFDVIDPELVDRQQVSTRVGSLLLPVRVKHPSVRRVANVVYGRAGGRNLRLDVYRPRDGRSGCPVVLQVHGGAWILGNKEQQGIPLLTYLASHGWVGFNTDYRLSPAATFPDHLVDLKRALAWIRAHGAEYGADPSFVLVTGGSAGGHLTALLGLTQGDLRYQPGFEDADTSVQACVPFYGEYDFLDRGHHRGRGHAQFIDFLAKWVMKSSPEDDPEAWAAASPIDRVRPDAPPFFVIHGSLDNLIPVAEAREFVARLREVSREPVVYAEVPGASHAFDIFHSVRANHMVRAVERFADWTLSRWRASGRVEEPPGGVDEAEVPGRGEMVDPTEDLEAGVG